MVRGAFGDDEEGVCDVEDLRLAPPSDEEGVCGVQNTRLASPGGETGVLHVDDLGAR